MSTDDIVITGMGAITPAGRGVEETWTGLLAGKARARIDAELEEPGTAVTISCRTPGFDPDEELGRGASRRLDRFAHLALIAAIEALDDAGLTADGEPRDDVDWDRVGIVLGSGIGGAETWAEEYPRFLEKGPGRVSPMFVPKMLSNTAAGMIAIRTGARGPNMTVNTACAAATSAIHLGRDLLRSGSADVVIVGGVEAGITGLAVSAFAQMGALSKNPDPETASRPFDVDRDGFVMGEGAGILVLERAGDADARGVNGDVRVAGAGASADAHHATAPPEDGGGAILAMQRALEDADIGADDVDHLNAHGTSTPLNDVSEARAIRAVFGDAADQVAVTSTKGVTGHLLGAAGGVEAIAAALAIRDGVVPPTANLTEQDPEIDLDVVSGEPRERQVDVAMSNSFGFGGQNATLVLSRVG
ncbi:MAG: beta-ketoacyl-ACP synthase II [Nitriliruptorales bacterium]|nr:beta-ketoacyl-ACP synthase II [Nitriliruptorales bacterium]